MFKIIPSCIFQISLAICLTICAPALTSAQMTHYPNRAIRLIVPYANGGPTDMLARMLAKRLQEELAQPVIVENKPGAGSIVGVDFVAKAGPDGYTLLFATGAALAINPFLNLKLPYQASDFLPISTVSSYSMFMLVNPKLDFHSVADLITYAKRYPGKLTFGSAGNGTSNHLAGELLKKMADVELTHVPYKGNAAAMTDVIGGTISFMFDLPSTSLPHAKADRVKLLATTGSGRSPLAPEVPTVSESGIKNFYVTSWFGVFAPAKTDDAIVVKLSQTIVGILKDPVITQLMAAQGYEVFGSTPQKLQEMLNQEITLWGELIRSAGIKLE